MREPLVTIVIVTYNSAEFMWRLAATLSVLSNERCKIIWVDNSSIPAQLSEYEAIQEKWLQGFELLKIWNAENIGFGAAVNAALACVESRYTLLLNPDVTLNSIWGTTIMEYALAGDFDIIGSPSFDTCGAHDRNIRRLPSIAHNIFGDLGCGVDHVRKGSGYIDFSCLLIKTSIFQRFGLLADYFLYGEDAEYWCRIRHLNLKIKYDKKIFYIHERSHSSVDGSYDKHLRIIYADMHGFSRDHGPWKRFMFLISLLVGISTRVILKPRAKVPRLRLVFAIQHSIRFLKGELYINDFHFVS